MVSCFIVPQNLELYGILLLIYCPHKLPHRIPHSSTIQLQRYRFNTEYHYRTLWTNLAVSLSKQVHFAVFLQLCFVNSAPACTAFNHFQDEKQDISLLWPYFLFPQYKANNFCWPKFVSLQNFVITVFIGIGGKLDGSVLARSFLHYYSIQALRFPN